MTFKVVEPTIEPCVADMVVNWPAVTPFARPDEVIVAAVRFEETHTTEVVMSREAPSEKVPVAVNLSVLSVDKDGFTGVTAIAAKVTPVTVRVATFDVPPPGAGFVTVTLKVPAVPISEARIAAVTCVPLTTVVVREFPLKFTTAPLTKPVPFTVSVNAAPPAAAVLGESVVIVGAGLLFVSDKFAGVLAPAPRALTV